MTNKISVQLNLGVVLKTLKQRNHLKGTKHFRFLDLPSSVRNQYQQNTGCFV